jgi:hypothetical protein
MDKPFKLFTTCVQSTARLIDEMVDNAQEVTYSTVAKHCDLSYFTEMYHGCPELSLATDYAVSFYKSTYQGKPCYYVDHSCIEHVYTRA